MILVRHGQSEFNAAFGETRVDPGIRDAGLTDLGRDQARHAARHLAPRIAATRLIASPYTRAIETALPLAEAFGLSVEIEPLVGEWAGFSCDIGTSRAALAERFPDIAFDHLDDPWWPDLGESEDSVLTRARRFRQAMAARADWQATVVVSHWGFIRALTGHPLPNGQSVRLDPRAAHPGGAVIVPLPET